MLCFVYKLRVHWLLFGSPVGNELGVAEKPPPAHAGTLWYWCGRPCAAQYEPAAQKLRWSGGALFPGAQRVL